MNLRNVRLILFREIRDQLRDRRTLFMIFVLPLLLYPLLGMSLLQAVQFRRPHASNVLAVNMPRLADLPPLADATGFDRRLFPDDPQDAELLSISGGGQEGSREAARRAVQPGNCDAALYFPPDFAARLAEFQKKVLRRDASELAAPFPVRKSSTRPPTSDRRSPADDFTRRCTIGSKNLARARCGRSTSPPRPCGPSTWKPKTSPRRPRTAARPSGRRFCR